MPPKPNIPEDVWRYIDRMNDTECWNWTASIRNKYGHFTMKGKDFRPHRIVYELYYDKIPEGLYVCHSCDNPLCCNPKHLFLGTHKDNMEDMKSKGRQLRGEKNGNAKLTEEDIRKIRKIYLYGESKYPKQYLLYYIQKMFRLSSSAYVSKIVNGDLWRHI